MPKPLTRDCLSEKDQKVLDSIFNPLELSSSVAGIIDVDASNINEFIDIEDTNDQVEKSKSLECEAVKLAESGQLNEALQKFLEALQFAPQRASVFNNRAQALRLAGRDEEALADLDKAIEISTDKLLKTKCQAYCQRGVLYRKQNNLDAARADFEEAVKLGSNFARTQLVEINPFAALCNQMLRQAFDQLK